MFIPNPIMAAMQIYRDQFGEKPTCNCFYPFHASFCYCVECSHCMVQYKFAIQLRKKKKKKKTSLGHEKKEFNAIEKKYFFTV